MKTLSGNRGFSLAEIMVVVVLFTILSAALLSTLLSAQQTWTTGSVEMVLTSELRKGLDTMSRELVESQAGQIQRPAANGAWDTALIFRVPEDRNQDGTVLDANGQIIEWSNDITYAMDGRGNNRCVKSQVNNPGLLPRTIVTTLANHITNLRFRRLAANPDMVEMEMTASTLSEEGRVRTRTMSTRVKVRN